MENLKDRKEKLKKLLKYTFIFTIIILFIATYYFAFKLKFHKELGGFHLKLNNFGKLSKKELIIYFPFMYLKWYFKYHHLKNLIPLFSSINNYIKLAYLLELIIIAFLNQKKVTVHGTARWANKEEIKKMNLFSENGVVLGCDPNGHILHDNGDKHIIMAAPTRGGKGINTVTPTAFDWDKSIIFNDIKGELWGLTSRYRKEVLGQKVFMFCPVDIEGISCSYNPLDCVKVGTPLEYEDATVISQTLIDTDGKGESDHWITSAINFLNGVILHVKYVNPNASLVDVIRFLSPTKQSVADQLADILCIPREYEEDFKFYGKYGSKDKPMPDGRLIKENLKPFDHLKNFENKNLLKEIYGKEADSTLHPLVAKEFAKFFYTPDKERGSVLTSAVQKLSILMDPVIQKHIKHSDFNIEQLMKEKCSLYLVTPPKSIARTKPLLRLIISQVVYQLTTRMKFSSSNKTKEKFYKKIIKEIKSRVKNFFIIEDKKKKNQLLLLIDEFPSLGKLSIVETAMSYIAGYGLKCLLITQSLKQFKSIYGKDNYILDNCSIQIYLTPNDDETPKMISEAFDTYTEKVTSTSKKGFELVPTVSTSYVPRKLMTAGEVRTLPYEDIILMITGQNPIRGKKLFYFKEKRYKDKMLGELDKTDINEAIEIIKTNYTTSSEYNFDKEFDDCLLQFFNTKIYDSKKNEYKNNAEENIIAITNLTLDAIELLKEKEKIEELEKDEYQLEIENHIEKDKEFIKYFKGRIENNNEEEEIIEY